MVRLRSVRSLIRGVYTHPTCPLILGGICSILTLWTGPAAAQTHNPAISGERQAPAGLALTLNRSLDARGFPLAPLRSPLPEAATQCDALATLLSSMPAARIEPALEPADKRLARNLGLDRLFILTPGPATDLEALAVLLAEFDLVFDAVEPLAVGRADQDEAEDFADPGMLPNDPYFPLQYALENIGQSVWGSLGIVDADIDASQAWLVSKGSPAVVVAVIDSGVSPDHPDLARQLVQGRNFTSDDIEDYSDEYVGHGTHIAGIIGGLLDNNLGIAGLAPGCRIMPVRVIDRFGFTVEEWVADGIVYAVDHGATVLNISIGFPTATSVLHGAVQYAHAKGAVICASSGNIATDPIGYPARYPETIAVGATDNLDEVTIFTSTGPQMTLVAPGRDIYSTWDTETEPDTYKRKSGTSFAAPYVAGAAALIRSVNPTLSPPQIRDILTRTAEDIGAPGWDEQSGAGRLNAFRAVVLARATPGDGEPTCIADMNGDGDLTFADVQLFLQAYAAEDAAADINHDHAIDFYDVQIYLSLFGAGCHQAVP